MASAKELARILTEGFEFEAPDEEGCVLPANIELYTEALNKVFYYLLEEAVDLMKKRPAQSVLKEILVKTESVAARVNKIIGGECLVGSSIFVILYVLNYKESLDKLKQYFNGEKDFIAFTSAVESSPIYNKLIEKAEDLEKKKEELNYFVPFKVTPFEDLIDNPQFIVKEILNSFMALGQYHRLGFTIDMVRPLIERVQFLNLSYKLYNKITKELVEEFEANRMATIIRLKNLYETQNKDED